jgi:multiple sugar transport system permease protein
MASAKLIITSIVAVIVAVAAVTFFLLPVYWLVVTSFKDPAGEMFVGNPLWVAEPTLKQYVNVLTGTEIVRWIGNSFLICGLSTLIGVMASTMGGYGLAKYAFKGRQALISGMSAMFLVPLAALAVPQFLMMIKIGWIGTYQAVILPCSLSVFGLFFMTIYVDAAVPHSLVEAARLDGAGELKIFFTIVLRMLGAGIVTLCLVIFIGSWNNFLLPTFVLPDVSKYLVTQGVGSYMMGGVQNRVLIYSYYVAGSVLSIAPIVAVFLWLEKYVERGLYLGRFA